MIEHRRREGSGRVRKSKREEERGKRKKGRQRGGRTGFYQCTGLACAGKVVGNE
jgi:hypothetical protein